MKRANVYRMYKGYRICSSFFDEELKNLYEESSFLKEYFLALQERYYSLKEKQLTETALDQEAVVSEFRSFLLENNILFGQAYYVSNCMYILTVDVHSEACRADEKIEIIVYKTNVDVRCSFDYVFKSVFCFLHAELPLAKRLFLDLRYSIWNDISEEVRAIKEKFEEIERKVYSVSNKSAQIAASSIQAICERQFSDSQLNVSARDYDAVIRTKDKRIRVFYADFLNDPQAFIKALAG